MKNLFSWLSLCMLATFLLYSCQEENFQEKINQDEIDFDNLDNPLYRDFFDFNHVSSSLLSQRDDGLVGLSEQTYEFQSSTLDAYEEVTTIIYFQELAELFLEDLIRRDGYPIWDRSINLSSAETDLFYVVPFSKVDGNEITAMLVVTRYGGDVQFNYWTKGELRDLLSREDIYQSHIDMAELILEANTWTYIHDETELQRTLDEMLHMPLNDGRCSPVYVEGESYEWQCTGPIAKLNVNGGNSGSRGCGWVAVGTTQIFAGWEGCDDFGDTGGGGGGGTTPGTGWPGDTGGGGTGSNSGTGSPSTGTTLGWSGNTAIGEITGGPTKGGKTFEPNLYLIPSFGDYQNHFSLQERKWLLDNLPVTLQVAEYINQNGGTLSADQQNNITDHVWLSQNFPGFNNSNIGSDAWVLEAIESLGDEELSIGLDEGISNTVNMSFEDFHELMESFEEMFDNPFPATDNGGTNLIGSDGEPEGTVRTTFNIDNLPIYGEITDNEFEINFSYDGFPTTIDENDIGSFATQYFQKILGIDTHTAIFTSNNDLIMHNGNDVGINALIFYETGAVNFGIKFNGSPVITTKKKNVALEIDFPMTTNQGWLTIANPRFLNVVLILSEN